MRDLESERIVIPLITEENYRQCLNLGIIGGCASVISIILKWIIYPSYISAILSDSTFTQIRINSLLQSISYFDAPIAILIGIGFFGFFAKNGMNEGYLFIFVFLLSVFSYPIYDYDIRDLLFLNSVDPSTTSAYILIILQSLVLFLILFRKSKFVTDVKVSKLASIMILLSPVLEYAWIYLSEPLSFTRDPLLNRIMGSMANGLLRATPNLIITILSAVIFSLVFYREKQSDVQTTLIHPKAIHSNNDELITISPPLVDSEIAKYLIILGVMGGILMLISLIVKSVLLSQYYLVLFSDGLLAPNPASQSLSYLVQLNVTIIFAIGLGFFGVFAKNGQRIGYIFLIAFIFPVADILYTSISSVAMILNPMLSLGFLYYGLEIVVAIVLAVLLWKNKDWTSNKTLLAVTSLALVLYEIIKIIWAFYARTLFVQYDLVNRAVQGTYSNAMLASTPDLLCQMILSLLYISLFVFEIRNKAFRMIRGTASEG